MIVDLIYSWLGSCQEMCDRNGYMASFTSWYILWLSVSRKRSSSFWSSCKYIILGVHKDVAELLVGVLLIDSFFYNSSFL